MRAPCLVLAVVLAFVLPACTLPARADEPAPLPRAVRTSDAGLPTAVADATPGCVDDGAPYDQRVLRDRIAFLASPELDGRAPGSTGDGRARAFIAERFRCLGLASPFDGGDFAQPFISEAGKDTANLIGYVAGADPDVGSEIVVVSAHHDHLGGGFLGANDDASGVAALLSIAQAVRQHAAPRRTNMFATFGAEEEGMVGSSFYVAHPVPALPLAHIVQFVELDMVGSHDSSKLVAAMGTFPGLGARKLLDGLVGHYPHIHVASGGRARGSDFEPFCRLGVPYAFFWTPDRRCYHEKCDTLARIDFSHMVDIAHLAGDLVDELADTKLDLAGLRRKRGCGMP
jgi:hypothetical protein